MFKRNLFKFKLKEETAELYHEYSIRPDTYSFKIPSTKPTSLQSIYHKAVNFPFGEKTPDEVYYSFPMTTSSKLARFNHRPKRVKMTTADFIEDSLYHPKYGYFSKEVEIYHPDKPFDYNHIKNIDHFLDEWQKSYSKYDQRSKTNDQRKANRDQNLSASSSSKFATQAVEAYKQDAALVDPTQRHLQLWHTPTELFNPYYGEALARYILVNYKLNHFPYDDLIIYEMGGGNGTLMTNILNFIKKTEPEIYKTTKYKIIEISNQLAHKQYRSKLAVEGLDASKLEIINKSIFDWDKVVTEPCFFIALEVFDNFAHDLVKYDDYGQPYEGKVLIDQLGDFYEFFTSDLSYYTDAYLNLRENTKYSILNSSYFKNYNHPLNEFKAKRKFINSFLPYNELSKGEFIPTRLLKFFQILKHKFPNHSLISSDFNQLPKTLSNSYNGPLVQTILKNKMVDVTTYMVHQGYFDIMFATDFDLMSELYKKVTNKVPKVESHKEFLQQWADLQVTSTKDGDNPMLDFYKNVSFMIS